MGSVYVRPGLVSTYTYATTLQITGFSLGSGGLATFTYVGSPEPTINEGFMLSGFTGIFSVLNGQTVYVEAVTMTTFMAVANGPLGTFSGLSGTATSLTGQFVGPNQGTVALSTSWLNPLNVYSPVAYASADTGSSVVSPIYPTTAVNLSSPNTAWTSPDNAIAVGASVASVSLSIGGAPPPPPPPPPSGIVIVQQNLGGYGSGTTSATSTAVGFNSATTAGNFLICVVWSGTTTGGSAPGGSPSTSGIVWSLAGVETYSDASTPQYGAVRVYYSANSAAIPTTTKTTASANKAGATFVEVEFSLYEFSGIAISSVVDTSAVASGSSSIPSTASLITSIIDLIFVSMIGEGNIPHLGSGYTAGIGTLNSTLSSGYSQYITNQAAGTIATAFGSTEYYWGCVAQAFKS